MMHKVGFILKVGCVAMPLCGVAAHAQPGPDYGFQFMAIGSLRRSRGILKARTHRFGYMTIVGFVAAAGLGATVARGQDYGIDFVTVGDVNNVSWMGKSPYGPPTAFGRGSVGYEYRIGRTEVTTAQWLEFVNTFTQREDSSFGLELLPVFWGAQRDFGYQGPGYRWTLRTDVPQANMLPVSYITWRDAALYCNWLHNGKPAERSQFITGAYDSTTWGQGGPYFTDAPTHQPGARFWIPTLDEWLKATHYDPHRYGDGQGGWWQYPNGTDEPLIPGLPGEGTTSFGYEPENPFAEWNIPLGAYPQSVSPWGLLDVSGGAREWTEYIFWPGMPYERGILGSDAGGPSFPIVDDVSVVQSLHPADAQSAGLRIVSPIPAPSSCLAIVGMGVVILRRFRKGDET